MKVFCDNEGAFTLTKKPRDHRKSTNINRKFHQIVYIVEDGEIVVKQVLLEDNPANSFTKGINKERHSIHAWSIGMRDDIKFSS